MTFGPKSSKLNSRPVYCSQLYSMWFDDLAPTKNLELTLGMVALVYYGIGMSMTSVAEFSLLVYKTTTGQEAI